MSRYYVSTIDIPKVDVLDTVDLTVSTVQTRDIIKFRQDSENSSKLINYKEDFDSSIDDTYIELKSGYISSMNNTLTVLCGKSRMKITWLKSGHLGVELDRGIFIAYNSATDEVSFNSYRNYTSFDTSTSLKLKHIAVSDDCLNVYFDSYDYILSINYNTMEIELQGVDLLEFDDFIERCIQTNQHSVIRPSVIQVCNFFKVCLNRKVVKLLLDEYWLKTKVILQSPIELDYIKWFIKRYNLKDYSGKLGKALFMLG